MNIDEIRKVFLNEIEKNCFNIDKEMSVQIKFCQYTNEINLLIFELLDLNKPNITLLDSKETELIRRRFGLFDNSQLKSINSLSDYYQKSHQYLLIYYKKILNKLLLRIIKGIPKPTYTKLSSIQVNDNFSNFHICNLNLDTRVYNALIKKNINYIYELLSYSTYELSTYLLSKETFKVVKNIVHSMGLRFIDELQTNEKLKIILREPYQKIDNSSIFWLDDSLMIKRKKIHSKLTISELREYITSSSDSELIDNIVLAANKVGIYFTKHKEYKPQNGNLNVSELLEFSLIQFNLSNRMYNILRRNGFVTIKDLVMTKSKELINLKSIGPIVAEEIIDFIHNLGLRFIDEVDLSIITCDININDIFRNNDNLDSKRKY